MFSRSLCLKVKSSNFGTPLPLRGGFPPNIRSRPAEYMQVSHFFACRSFVAFDYSVPSLPTYRGYPSDSKALYNRGVKHRPAKKSAQKLAYMQFL